MDMEHALVISDYKLLSHLKTCLTSNRGELLMVESLEVFHLEGLSQLGQSLFHLWQINLLESLGHLVKLLLCHGGGMKTYVVYRLCDAFLVNKWARLASLTLILNTEVRNPGAAVVSSGPYRSDSAWILRVSPDQGTKQKKRKIKLGAQYTQRQ